LLSRTAIRVESVCQALLYKPSKEGEYAALVLARLYARPDCTKGLQPFLSLMKLELERTNGEYDEMEAIYVRALSARTCPYDTITDLSCNHSLQTFSVFSQSSHLYSLQTSYRHI
jgi:hypothetical protein